MYISNSTIAPYCLSNYKDHIGADIYTAFKNHPREICNENILKNIIILLQDIIIRPITPTKTTTII